MYSHSCCFFPGLPGDSGFDGQPGIPGASGSKGAFFQAWKNDIKDSTDFINSTDVSKCQRRHSELGRDNLNILLILINLFSSTCSTKM